MTQFKDDPLIIRYNRWAEAVADADDHWHVAGMNGEAHTIIERHNADLIVKILMALKEGRPVQIAPPE